MKDCNLAQSNKGEGVDMEKERCVCVCKEGGSRRGDGRKRGGDKGS